MRGVRRPRLPRSRAARAAVLAAIAALALAGSWTLWPRTRALAVELKDQLGFVLVERYAKELEAAGRESSVDPPLLAAVMYMESRGRGGRTSHAGAHGLMQLVPAAASDAARRLGLPEPSVEELLEDDGLNIRLGAAHLAWLLQHRGDWSLEQVLVSYNAGRAKLFRWIERDGGYEGWRAQEIRRELAGEETTGALRYALEAIAAREELLARGKIARLPGVEVLP